MAFVDNHGCKSDVALTLTALSGGNLLLLYRVGRCIVLRYIVVSILWLYNTYFCLNLGYFGH